MLADWAGEGCSEPVYALSDLIVHACVALVSIHALIARKVLDAGQLHRDAIRPCRFWRMGHTDGAALDIYARRLLHSFTSQLLAAKSTRHGIWLDGMVCCSRMFMAATMILIW